MTNNQNMARWDVVLLGEFMHSVAAGVRSELQLGGLMGSLFS